MEPTRLLHLWDFPGKNTGMGCHFLLQEIFPTQGLNLGLPHCRQMLYHLSHQGHKTWNIFWVYSASGNIWWSPNSNHQNPTSIHLIKKKVPLSFTNSGISLLPSECLTHINNLKATQWLTMRILPMLTMIITGYLNYWWFNHHWKSWLKTQHSKN